MKSLKNRPSLEYVFDNFYDYYYYYYIYKRERIDPKTKAALKAVGFIGNCTVREILTHDH